MVRNSRGKIAARKGCLADWYRARGKAHFVSGLASERMSKVPMTPEID